MRIIRFISTIVIYFFLTDAAVALETAFNFLQQGDIEMNCNELESFRALKRKVKLHGIARQKQGRIGSFVTD